MRKSFYLMLLFISLLSSCRYSRDEKLKVINNSNTKIWYQVLIKYKNENSYLHVGVGRELQELAEDNPIITRDIKDYMDEFSYNKTLYVIYYDNTDMEYVHKNLEFLIDSKKFRVDKYSQKELDSLNWVVKYNVK